MTVGRIFTKYISSQNHRVLELKNKGRTLLSSSRLELLEYSEQPYLCDMRFDWCEFMGIRSLQIVCISNVRFAFWAFFSKTGKTRVSHRVKMMTL